MSTGSGSAIGCWRKTLPVTGHLSDRSIRNLPLSHFRLLGRSGRLLNLTQRPLCAILQPISLGIPDPTQQSRPVQSYVQIVALTKLDEFVMLQPADNDAW